MHTAVAIELEESCVQCAAAPMQEPNREDTVVSILVDVRLVIPCDLQSVKPTRHTIGHCDVVARLGSR